MPLHLADALPEGFVLGGYQVVRRLGAGGMGVVYQAHDPQLERGVALKLLLAAFAGDPDMRRRFLAEAKAAARIEHPHVVRIYAVGEDQEVPFIAMELLEGEGLDRRLLREGRLAPAVACDLLLPVAGALGAAHARGLIHRDVKPANVFLGGKPAPKLLDFGIAKLVERGGRASSRLVGTLDYLAPEQVVGAGPADERVDQYMLAVTLYECLTGRVPFQGATQYELMQAIDRGQPPPPRAHAPELPRALEAAVLRAMARDPAARFESVLHLAAALLPHASDRGRALHVDELAAASAEGPLPAPPPGAGVPAPDPRARELLQRRTVVDDGSAARAEETAPDEPTGQAEAARPGLAEPGGAAGAVAAERAAPRREASPARAVAASSPASSRSVEPPRPAQAAALADPSAASVAGARGPSGAPASAGSAAAAPADRVRTPAAPKALVGLLGLALSLGAVAGWPWLGALLRGGDPSADAAPVSPPAARPDAELPADGAVDATVEETPDASAEAPAADAGGAAPPGEVNAPVKLREACGRGDGRACLELGDRQPDCARAAAPYARACGAGVDRGCRKMAESLATQCAFTVEGWMLDVFDRRCRGTPRSSDACAVLGMILSGQGSETFLGPGSGRPSFKDCARSVPLLREACHAMNNAYACMGLAQELNYSSTRYCAIPSCEGQRRALQLACAGGNSHGCLAEARFLSDRCVEDERTEPAAPAGAQRTVLLPDVDKALPQLARLCRAGVYEACARLEGPCQRQAKGASSEWGAWDACGDLQAACAAGREEGCAAHTRATRGRLLGKARTLAAAGEWPDTILVLTSLLHTGRPSYTYLFPEARLLLADALLANGSRREAIEEYGTVLARYAQTTWAPEAALKLGKLFAAQGEQEKARGYFRRLLSRYPDSTSAAEARALLQAP